MLAVALLSNASASSECMTDVLYRLIAIDTCDLSPEWWEKFKGRKTDSPSIE